MSLSSVILGGQLWKRWWWQQRNRSRSQLTPWPSNGDTVWGGGEESVPLLTCHCEPSRLILVLINGPVCCASQGKSRAVFPLTEAPVYLPTTDGPPGAPGSFAPTLPYALSILHLNQWAGSWAQPPNLQVTSVTCPPSQSYQIKNSSSLLCFSLAQYVCC